MEKSKSSKTIAFILAITCICSLYAPLPAKETKPINTNTAHAASVKIISLTEDEISSKLEDIVGDSWAQNRCLAFVADFFANLGAARNSACCAWKYSTQHCTSSSRENIPIGADIFFSSDNCKYNVTDEYGHNCGHTGIYAGNGYVIHACTKSGKTQVWKDKISTIESWGYKYIGWGIHENVNIVQSNIKSGMTISGETAPTGQLKENHYFEIKGKINSAENIGTVWGGVYDRITGEKTSAFCEDKPNAKFYDLGHKFNDLLIFDNLEVGYYTYRIEATDADGKTYKLIESDFQIGSPKKSYMKISNETCPVGVLPQGHFFEIKGEINSIENINTVWGGVYDRITGEKTSAFCEDKPNTKSYDLGHKFNDLLIFDNLGTGDYTYRIEATDTLGERFTIIESDFQIGDPENKQNYFVKGIDVSAFQKEIDWEKVAENDIEFAIIRNGSTHIETADYMEDSFFQRNYAGASSVGLKLGSYVYTSANSISEMKENMNSILKTLDGKNFDLPVYIDVESSNRQMKIGKTELTKVLLYGANMLKEAGYTPGIYASSEWFKNYIDKQCLIDNNVEIWLASWPSKTLEVNPEKYDKSSECTVWQYACVGKVNGISGNVDVDVLYTSSNSINSIEEDIILLGDFNMDGKVDVTDLSELSVALVDKKEITEKARSNADVDGDGELTLTDLATIKQFLVKAITSFCS